MQTFATAIYLMKVASAALNQTPLDWSGNQHRIVEAIRSAKAGGARILVLPELCITGYGCDDYFYMPWVTEEAENRLCALLPETKNMLVAVGLPLLWQGKRYNTLAILANGAISGFYAKQQMARTGVYYEPRWFDAWPALQVAEVEFKGSLVPFGDILIRYEGLNIGFEICEDAWNPEVRPALYGAARDADLILNASASHFARGKQAERHEIIYTLEGRNDCYYLYANLVGNESGRLVFDGELLFGAAGKLVSASNRFGFAEVRVAIFELEPAEGLKFYQVPKEDDYENFTAACSLALLDYLRKAKARGFALSLSGGADSAACAVLVAEMLRRAEAELGKPGLEQKLGFSLKGNSARDWCEEMLFCAYQGTSNSGEITRGAAAAVAQQIGARYTSWEIDELVSVYTRITENALNQQFDWKNNDLVLQNIQARTRAPGIWMAANALQFLLLTTSNRSEGDVGYCTMDGDTAGSLAPIAGVSKHFIRNWLVWAKEVLGYSALDLMINQAPTAELRPGETKQTDEADLMPYELLEAIEIQLILEKKSIEETIRVLTSTRTESREYLQAQVDRFVSMWKRNQWKRERLAPSFHLDRFDIDPKSGGRYPIFCG